MTRDKSGNPLTWGDSTDSYNKVYSYDANSRLASANLPGYPAVPYTYDWVGNRLNPGSYTYNAADQLTSENGHDYSYDGNGNLTSISGTGGKTFTYTANNLVNTVVGSATSTFTWDALGNRVKLVTSGATTYGYVYNALAGIPAVLEEVAGGTSTYYIREPNGALLARCTSATAVAHYYHFDELGSTQFLTGSNATISDKYSYDPWGNVTSHTGALNQPYQFVGQLGYYTHYNDTNLPYIQTGVRLYVPGLGRYVQEDKWKVGFNWYSYVGENPINYSDPSGLINKKKIAKCAAKAAYKCKGKVGKGLEDCLLKEFISCYGDGWAANVCKAAYCLLFPRDTECQGGEDDVADCQHKCAIDFYCCTFTGGFTAACEKKAETCHAGCLSMGCKP